MWRKATIVLTIAIVLLSVSDPRKAAQAASIGPYLRWNGESASAKEFIVATAISAIQEGWSFGAAQAQADVGGYLVDEYRRGAVSIRIPGAVGTMKVTDPPRFTHSMRFYVALINRAYRRSPRYRTSDISGMLLCFADRPPGKCPTSLILEHKAKSTKR